MSIDGGEQYGVVRPHLFYALHIALARTYSILIVNEQ